MKPDNLIKRVMGKIPPPVINWGTIICMFLLIFPAMLYSQSGEKYSVNMNSLGLSDKFGSSNYAPVRIFTNSTLRALFTADGNFEAWYNSYFKKSVVVDSTITAWEVYAMYRLSVYGDAEITGKINAAKLILTDGNITSMTGTINLGSNNLTTTGNITAGSFRSSNLTGNGKALLNANDDGDIIRKEYSGNPNDVLTGDGNWSNLSQSTGWQWVDTNLVSTAAQVVVANNLAVGGKITVGQMKVISNGSNKDTLHTEKELVIITDSKNISLEADTVKIPRLLDSKRMETDTLNSKKINASKVYVAGDITSTGTVYTGNLYVANDVMLPLFAGTKNLLLTDSTGKVSPLGVSSTSNKVLLSNGTWGAVPIPQNYWQMQNDDIYTLTPGNIGLGMNNPAYKLDVAGDARVSNNLYVGGNLAVSDRFNAGTVISDTSRTAKQLYVNHNLKLGSDSGSVYSDITGISGNLKIQSDPQTTYNVLIGIGNDSKIGIGEPSPTEKLAVDGNVKVTGKISADCVNASCLNITGQTNFDSLHVVNKLKVGNSVIIDAPGPENNIYTTNGNLLINCVPNLNHNTVLNAGSNSGNIGLGTLMPAKKVHIMTTNDHANSQDCSTTLRLEHNFNGSPNGCGSSVWDITSWGWNGSYLKFTEPSSGTPALIMSSDGKIGISVSNTDDLTERLNVNGYGKFYSRDNNGIIGSTTIGFNGANGYLNTYGGGLLINYYSGNDVVVGGDNVYGASTGNFSANHNAYLAAIDGNVGIATSSPDQDSKLHVAGNSFLQGKVNINSIDPNPDPNNFTKLYVGDPTIGWPLNNGIIKFENILSKVNFCYRNSSHMNVGIHTVNNDVGFSRGLIVEVPAYSIAATFNRKVGIGTEWPAALLHVFHNTINDPALIAGDTSARSIWLIPYVGESGYQHISKEGDIGIFFRNQNQNAGESGLVIAPHFSPVSGEIMGIRIDKDGNVGIGKKVPNYKLDVCGTIHSTEWIVETFGCDFVFEDTYKRMTFEEKEKWFKENKRLKGIAPASEIEKDGMKAGETLSGIIMNIEENSLDIIDIFKENRKLQKQIDELKKENIKLQEDIQWLKNKN